jgi:beta-glucosidase
VAIRFERGCDIDRMAPELRADWEVDFGGSDYVARRDSGLLMFDAVPEPLDIRDFTFTARARFTPEEPGVHTFTLVQAGGARVRVAGEVVLDGIADPPPRGEALIGMASEEVAAEVELAAGEPVDVEVEFTSEGAPAGLRGVKIGLRPPAPADLIDRAARAAASADATVVIVGTTDEWESEGSDRSSMDLPGTQDELIERVLDADPDAIVVVNAASPVTMDWAERARAVLIPWFGGQEMANALADVLLGDADPAGRMPTTVPIRLEHNPSYGNFPGENSEVRYGEGVLIGYRWYEARRLPVRLPFGHGLSYTSFALGEPRVSSETFAPGDTLRVEIDVTNTGDRRGAEVVQLYVAPLSPLLVRPPKELKGYEKVWLDPGEAATVAFELTDRAFACWDPGDPAWESLRPRAAVSPMIKDEPRPTEGRWHVEPGPYELHIGRSSADIARIVSVTV